MKKPPKTFDVNSSTFKWLRTCVWWPLYALNGHRESKNKRWLNTKLFIDYIDNTWNSTHLMPLSIHRSYPKHISCWNACCHFSCGKQPLLAVLPLLTPPATGYVIERHLVSSKSYGLSINSKWTKCYFYSRTVSLKITAYGEDDRRLIPSSFSVISQELVLKGWCAW